MISFTGKAPRQPCARGRPPLVRPSRSTRWRDQSWRDPWLFQVPGDNSFHVLVTARSRHGAPDGAGVVGHARSPDLVGWEVLPPLTEHGEFAQVEVPQLVRLNGRYEILVSCLAEDHSRDRVARLGTSGQTGTFVFSADELLGPYSYSSGPVAAPDGPLGALYAGKLVEAEAGTWRFMAFRGDGDRTFLGELTDPLPVYGESDGRILVVLPTGLTEVVR